jgi:hypothetical protein
LGACPQDPLAVGLAGTAGSSVDPRLWRFARIIIRSPNILLASLELSTLLVAQAFIVGAAVMPGVAVVIVMIGMAIGGHVITSVFEMKFVFWNVDGWIWDEMHQERECDDDSHGFGGCKSEAGGEQDGFGEW